MLMFEPAVDQDIARHLVHSMRRHADWCRRNAMQVPAGWTTLMEHFAATSGQGRPTFADGDAIPDPVIAPPALLTMREAREVLSVSERTLRRLVASGRLVAVNVDGCRRIRRVDLDRYITELPTTRETA